MLADAAAELFLEQGYGRTTVDQIAARAGVSRATFFNYFPAKSDVMWLELDAAVAALPELLAASTEPTAVRAVEDALQPHGFAVFLCNTDENPEREALYLELLADEQVAGVILTPAQAEAGRLEQARVRAEQARERDLSGLAELEQRLAAAQAAPEDAEPRALSRDEMPVPILR